ncbi:transglycosylase SLT domain-containing protein [Luteimonas kalidii]|uniref:Transglycosylase SLT domain-containing protein n=1 Tax=Luteimonas kalidii TaxID=3042025 RepID=A0ABT6JS11_9GAMM|nr:lytic transglycosylase domain-containing protein [Luteimonas kalidii]MDH5832936.1 transglycosylase SLT domain-containing protein [Luteimonas kalidii]
MRARSVMAGLALLCALAGPAMAGHDAAPAPPATGSMVDAETAPTAGVADAAPTPPADGGRLPDAAPDAAAGTPVPDAAQDLAAARPAPAGMRSGLEVYRSFREGLADPVCEPGASDRWRHHFANAPAQLAAPGSDVLPLFGYVVDRLREAHLPTEFALIPFVESGYRPGARSAQGPAGLWQFISLTARNHKVAVRPGYDGRLSPVDSTEAAVRYLKTLHGMFAGDWRLAVMAYNAGEYRLLGALRRAGQRPADADPASLPMPAITLSYVRKLHALSCLLTESGDRDAWLQALDRPVPVLTAAEVPVQLASLDGIARRHGADATQLRRLNPVYADGRIARAGSDRARVLLPARQAQALLAAHPAAPAAAPAQAPARALAADDLSDAMADASAHLEPAPRTHVVARGESAWRIAGRYGVELAELLGRNGLDARGVLRPGMVLQIDPVGPAPGAAASTVAE